LADIIVQVSPLKLVSKHKLYRIARIRGIHEWPRRG